MSPSATGVPVPILNQRSSIFAHSPPMWPGSMAMWRLVRGFPEGGMGRSAVDFQVRGAGRFFSGVAKRRMKTGSVGSEDVRMAAEVSLRVMNSRQVSSVVKMLVRSFSKSLRVMVCWYASSDDQSGFSARIERVGELGGGVLNSSGVGALRSSVVGLSADFLMPMATKRTMAPRMETVMRAGLRIRLELIRRSGNRNFQDWLG